MTEILSISFGLVCSVLQELLTLDVVEVAELLLLEHGDSMFQSRSFVDVFFPQAKIQLISLSRLVLLIYVLTRHAIRGAYFPRFPPSVSWNVRPPTGATTLALFLLSRDLALN